MKLVDWIGSELFTLALSSGFFGFYSHVGFLKALHEVGFKPSAYSGTSAGALVAAFAARGFSVQEIEKIILSVRRKDIWDPFPGLGVLRGRKFEKLLINELGENFSNLEKPLSIPVFDIASRSTSVFTSGNLARAVRASCAVPVMFHPVRIGYRFYWDGGIQDKLGISGLDKKTKILSHYLDAGYQNAHSIYEMKRDTAIIEERANNLHQIQLKGVPGCHPFAMDRGPEIINAAYQKTLERFSF